MTNHQYFAQIDDENIVTDVAVVTYEFMQENPERYTGTWVETFFNLEGKTYAGIGYVYDPVTRNFSEPIPPDPTPIPNTD
tara:strand:- start:47 stop:286 length:240 start_codon:yes stop_codon:yes gene_type:complete